jgi:hypothetical protein
VRNVLDIKAFNVNNKSQQFCASLTIARSSIAPIESTLFSLIEFGAGDAKTGGQGNRLPKRGLLGGSLDQ